MTADSAQSKTVALELLELLYPARPLCQQPALIKNTDLDATLLLRRVNGRRRVRRSHLRSMGCLQFPHHIAADDVGSLRPVPAWRSNGKINPADLIMRL